MDAWYGGVREERAVTRGDRTSALQPGRRLRAMPAMVGTASMDPEHYLTRVDSARDPRGR